MRLGPLRLDFGTFFAHGMRAIAHLDASPHPTRLTFSTPQTPPMGPYAMVLAYWDVLGLFLYGHTGPFLHAEPECQGGQQHPV